MSGLEKLRFTSLRPRSHHRIEDSTSLAPESLSFELALEIGHSVEIELYYVFVCQRT